MAHEIEGNNAFFGNNLPAWHGLGTVIPEDVVTTQRALELAGLDWEVEKHPLEIILPNGETTIVPRQYANIRSTDSKVLGIVGERYGVFQNRQAFEFGDRLVDDYGAKWHTAGSLFGGTQAWMLMKLPQDVLIAGEESERIQPFICFRNSHDGSSCLEVFTTFTRVVCNNTLTWALADTPRKFSIRHKGDLMRYVSQVQEALGIMFNLLAQLEREGEQLITQEFSTRDFDRMLRELMPEPDSEEQQRKHNMWSDKIAEYRDYFVNRDNLQNITGTKWGALQAITEVADHNLTLRKQVHDVADTRFDRILNGHAIVQQAYDYLMAS